MATGTSLVRRRPRSWCSGSARFVLSAVATIVQSGLQISTDAYTPLWTGRHPHVEGLVQQRAQVRRFSSESQQRLAGETRRLRIEGRLVMMGTTTAGTPSGTQTCTGSDKKKVHRRNTSSGRRKRSSVTLASTETTVNTTAVDVAGGVVDTDAVGAQVLVKKGKPRVRRRRTAEKAMNDPPEDEIADELHPKTKFMTPVEEIARVSEVKVLVSYRKVHTELVDTLGRVPTPKEWANSLGISTKELANQEAVSQRAQERIVRSNIGLIFLTAQKHYPSILYSGTVTGDLVQEGSLGLLRAAETFDASLGFRFSTYAGWWIRNRVQKCVRQQTTTIRLPHHVHNFRQSSKKAVKLLKKKLGRKPTNNEIADHMDVDVKKVVLYLKCSKVFSLDESFSWSGKGDSGSRGESGSIQGGERIGDTPISRHEKIPCSLTNPEQTAEATLFGMELDKLMNVLTPDERQVVSLLYGLFGFTATPLGEVAQLAGTSNYHIRLLETRAFNKLRRRRGRPRNVGSLGSKAAGRDIGQRGRGKVLMSDIF